MRNFCVKKPMCIHVLLFFHTKTYVLPMSECSVAINNYNEVLSLLSQDFSLTRIRYAYGPDGNYCPGDKIHFLVVK